MKRISAFSLAAMLATSSFAADDMAALKAELNELKAQIAELKKNQEASDVASLAKQMQELKTRTGGDNLKWDVDYRVSYDMISQKTAGGAEMDNGILSNRLWLGMKAAPRKDFSFIGQLAYNKSFGDTANHSQANVNAGYSNFDWVVNENTGDNAVKVKTLYGIYFGDIGDVSYTASIGRRASTNGTLANLRSDDAEASPNGHMINVEFDGASFNFNLDKVTGVPGMAFKLCMGRGLTNAEPRFAQTSAGVNMAYFNDKTKNTHIDMFGFIFTPYDDGQYRLTTQAFKAWNLIGFKYNNPANPMLGYEGMSFVPDYSGTNADGILRDTSGNPIMTSGPAFRNVGDMYGFTVSAIATGIGNGWSDFLDNTTAFASWSMSKTDPKPGDRMLGSTDNKVGTSWWVGLQMPAVVTKDGKIGLEYNQGSKYWRSFTYGEDTMVGSKLAARGKAYEAYYTQPILGKTLSAQLRYTKINYDYTGSNAFFADDGMPIDINDAMAVNATKSASNLMGYLRYRY